MLIGIDIAKAELVVAARSSGEQWTVANDERGARTLVERLMSCYEAGRDGYIELWQALV